MASEGDKEVGVRSLYGDGILESPTAGGTDVAQFVEGVKGEEEKKLRVQDERKGMEGQVDI